mmetsp:Transcript_80891/g.228995  ORF Transcript_80891/g.228995 Transcript_80891/m.228995 type:complete len:234 (+) Transcript_80891:463-1164(+)
MRAESRHGGRQQQAQEPAAGRGRRVPLEAQRHVEVVPACSSSYISALPFMIGSSVLRRLAPAQLRGLRDNPQPRPCGPGVALRAADHGPEPPLALMCAEEQEDVAAIAMLQWLTLVDRPCIAEALLLDVALPCHIYSARDRLCRVYDLDSLGLLVQVLPRGFDLQRREHGRRGVHPGAPALDRRPEAPLASGEPQGRNSQGICLVVHRALVQELRGSAVHSVGGSVTCCNALH